MPLTILSLLIALSVVLLPWRPWSTRESLNADPALASADLSDVTVLIPARNEAGMIAATLRGVSGQGAGLKVIVIDDESTDATAEIARTSAIQHLHVIRGAKIGPGWSGKLWALEQARTQVQTPLTLLLDADIALAPGTIATLRHKLQAEDLQLVSLMAHLGMESPCEKLLLPAFIYFFKLIYPFRLANDPRSVMAAAAGGCILLRTDALVRIGGFAALKDALIDDCALAFLIKHQAGGIWVGLTQSAHSQRRYTFRDIWNMVARTAYTQLRYSPLLLGLCTLIMCVYYLVPVAGLMRFPDSPWIVAAAAYGLLAAPYAVTLRYYRLSMWRSLLLPLTAVLYLGMTWNSAWRYYAGERSRWKDRSYQRAH